MDKARIRDERKCTEMATTTNGRRNRRIVLISAACLWCEFCTTRLSHSAHDLVLLRSPKVERDEGSCREGYEGD